jgi:hypothetical protein
LFCHVKDSLPEAKQQPKKALGYAKNMGMIVTPSDEWLKVVEWGIFGGARREVAK